jgi:hypothetical protein
MAALVISVGCSSKPDGIDVADTRDKPLFIMRERLSTWAKRPCPLGTLVKDLSLSELTIFIGGDAEQHTWHIPACTDPSRAWDWKPPVGNDVRKRRIGSSDYQRFRKFLDDPNVTALTSFLNAGPGIGDYEIEIHRASGVQQVSVGSLAPDHVELA